MTTANAKTFSGFSREQEIAIARGIGGRLPSDFYPPRPKNKTRKKEIKHAKTISRIRPCC